MLHRSSMFLAMPRCDTFCTNFEGTYQCSCNTGFMLDEADDSGHTCRDINECTANFISHANSKCVNIFGGGHAVFAAGQLGQQGME